MSFQPHARGPRHDDQSLLDSDLHMLDDFDDSHVENVDDWVNDQHIVKLAQKDPSKISKAMALEVSSQ